MLHWLRKILGRQPPSTNAGERGEHLAAAWLTRERGFVVLVRNWRSPRDRREEIDLVCRDGDALVFVEVKARADGALVPGYYAVDQRKRRVLRRAIGAYLAQLRVKPPTFRLDIVEVCSERAGPKHASDSTNDSNALSVNAPVVLHFENVPFFSKHFRG